MDEGKAFILEKLLDESAISTFDKIIVGEIYNGKIVDINENRILIDLGLKIEGFVPKSEFVQDCSFKVGDEIPVKVLEKVPGESPRLSWKQAHLEVTMQKLVNSKKENLPVKCYVKKLTKGGFIVDVGIPAFMPASQIDVRPVKNLKKWIDKIVDVVITEINPKTLKIIVSRRKYLEEVKEKLKQETLLKLKENDIVNGKIIAIKKFGAFVEVGGIDGLLPINEISWGRIDRIDDYLKEDDEIQVKVLKFDPQHQKLVLSVKQLYPEPWSIIDQKYKLFDVVLGKVTNITEFGAFVELEPAIEGLIHISELSWTNNFKHPKEILSCGEKIKVKILNIDKINRKLSLSLKQATKNPYQEFKENYEDTKVWGEVKSLTPFGVFVRLPLNLDGLLHISNVSWTKVENLEDFFKVGDKIEVVVLNVDVDNKRISLGYKQLQPNPFVSLNPDEIVECTVSEFNEDGIKVFLKDNLPGIIPSYEIPEEFNIKANEKTYAKITHINQREKVVYLSIKRLKV